MATDRIIISELRKNVIGKLFTKFNAPLVKTIDIPYNALNKDFMLIHRH